ncbi:hypothetical protein DYB26_001339 [Aphanomyces astaci]|uniref:Uncharacterized protein n=1 Tax=Aphanomyces astaci TaxID=112090 RepID=A0A397FIM1_APHAT|nr:hypothetical protein DYB34_002955 [Aphanomyces astaci]RHZ19459.1 hypothetical protein DYB26_001339 [Aphanomyces astaci]RHZ32138.1 hypothetical protein DYB31_000343 [Aphanomyces astaci]
MLHEFAFQDKLDTSLQWHTLDDLKLDVIVNVNLDSIHLVPSHPVSLTSSEESSWTTIQHALPSTPPPTDATLVQNPQQNCQFARCQHPAKVVHGYGFYCNRHVVSIPCGFPRCRDKANIASNMCLKHADKLDAAELSPRSQSTRTCRTDGCFKVRQGRGHCTAHEKLLIAMGKLQCKQRDNMTIAFTMCCFPECTKHAQRNRFCCKHGKELHVQAQAMVDRGTSIHSFDEILTAIHNTLRRCQYDRCEKNARYNQLCTTHYHLKHGRPSQSPHIVAADT